MDPLTAISTRQTPQNEQADPRQIPNTAGGYGFKLGDDARIHRSAVPTLISDFSRRSL